MDISNLNKIFFLLFTGLLYFSCNTINEQQKLTTIQDQCATKKHIDGFLISFLGYAYEEIKVIEIIKSSDKKNTIMLDVPEKIRDSLRMSRHVFFKNVIALNDTVILSFPNQETHILTNFQYQVRPHFSMGSKDYGCDFYQMDIDGKTEMGGTAFFIKKGFQIKSK